MKNRNGQCYPTQKQIAEAIHCNECQVKVYVKGLEDCSYIATEKVGQRHNIVYTVLDGDAASYDGLPEWVNQAARSRTTRTGGSAKVLEPLNEVVRQDKLNASSSSNHSPSVLEPPIECPRTTLAGGVSNPLSNSLSNKVKVRVAAQPAFVIPKEKEFTDYCIESGLGLGDGAEACDEFWRMHQQDNWTIGGEKIKYWKKALRSFALHYENCHDGEPSPPPSSNRGQYKPEIEEVVARCCINCLTPNETMACVAFIKANGFVVESLPGEWAEIVGPDGWERALDEWAVRNVGEKELYKRMEKKRAEKSQASPPAPTQP